MLTFVFESYERGGRESDAVVEKVVEKRSTAIDVWNFPAYK